MVWWLDSLLLGDLWGEGGMLCWVLSSLVVVLSGWWWRHIHGVWKSADLFLLLRVDVACNGAPLCPVPCSLCPVAVHVDHPRSGQSGRVCGRDGCVAVCVLVVARFRFRSALRVC